MRIRIPRSATRVGGQNVTSTEFSVLGVHARFREVRVSGFGKRADVARSLDFDLGVRSDSSRQVPPSSFFAQKTTADSRGQSFETQILGGPLTSA